jgi:hypothetical protein
MINISIPRNCAADRRKDPFRIGLERPLFGQLAAQVADLNEAQVNVALEQQSREGGRLGDILLCRGWLNCEQVAEILRLQAEWIASALGDCLEGGSFPYPARLSVCLPAFNEEANIADTLRAACAILPAFVRDFEIVVVDDGSSDRTAAIVSEMAQAEPRIRLVGHEHNRGYGAAVATGLRAASGELIFFMDADGQFSLLDLGQLLVRLQGHDAAVGYRYARADSLRRRLMAWGWNRLVGLVLGVRVHDLDCAFKLFRRLVIDQVVLTATSPAINAEILLQCAQAGLRIAETPVQHYPRYHGVAAGCNLRMITRAFRELPRLFRCRLAVGRREPVRAPIPLLKLRTQAPKVG